MHTLTIIYCDDDHKEIYHEVLHCKDRYTLQWYANVLKNRDNNIQYFIDRDTDTQEELYEWAKEHGYFRRKHNEQQ